MHSKAHLLWFVPKDILKNVVNIKFPNLNLNLKALSGDIDTLVQNLYFYFYQGSSTFFISGGGISRSLSKINTELYFAIDNPVLIATPFPLLLFKVMRFIKLHSFKTSELLHHHCRHHAIISFLLLRKSYKPFKVLYGIISL